MKGGHGEGCVTLFRNSREAHSPPPQTLLVETIESHFSPRTRESEKLNYLPKVTHTAA